MIQYQQTDTTATFTGAGITGQPTNAGGTVNRLCIGTPGSATNSLTLDANAKDFYAVSWDIPIPNFTLWNPGTWTVRLNVQQGNASVTWNRTYIFRLNSAGQNQGLIGSQLRVPQVLGNPGVRWVSFPGEAQFLRSYGDRVLIVLCFSNQGTLPPYNLVVNNSSPQVWSFIPSEFIDSPFSGGN